MLLSNFNDRYSNTNSRNDVKYANKKYIIFERENIAFEQTGNNCAKASEFILLKYSFSKKEKILL